MFVVEFTTRVGKVCESFPTYEEASQRVAQFPADQLVDMPLLFEELPDGSQRLVREDGKPLQWHRLPEDRFESAQADPLPVSDLAIPGASVRQLPASAGPQTEEDPPLLFP